jgi:hypothetical protein
MSGRGMGANGEAERRRGSLSPPLRGERAGVRGKVISKNLVSANQR